MLKCPNCSAKIDNSRHYCPKCGTALTQRFTTPAHAPATISWKLILLTACFLILAVILIGAALFPRSGKYTEPDALIQEYLALLTVNKPEQMEKLFLPELMDIVDLSQMDGCYAAYGTVFETLGTYDVTDESQLNAGLIQRLLRNNYGLEVQVEDYNRQLAGVIVDGTDVWFNIDMVRIDNYWYIVQVTA